MGDAGPAPEQRVPWWWRHQGMVLAITALAVLGGVLSIFIRIRTGMGPTTDVDVESLLVLLVIAAPGALFPFLTRRWQIWVPECLLSIGAWVLPDSSRRSVLC